MTCRQAVGAAQSDPHKNPAPDMPPKRRSASRIGRRHESDWECDYAAALRTAGRNIKAMGRRFVWEGRGLELRLRRRARADIPGISKRIASRFELASAEVELDIRRRLDLIYGWRFA